MPNQHIINFLNSFYIKIKKIFYLKIKKNAIRITINLNNIKIS